MYVHKIFFLLRHLMKKKATQELGNKERTDKNRYARNFFSKMGDALYVYVKCNSLDCIHLNAQRTAWGKPALNKTTTTKNRRQRSRVTDKWHWERETTEQQKNYRTVYVGAVHYAYRKMRNNKHSFLSLFDRTTLFSHSGSWIRLIVLFVSTFTTPVFFN